MSQVTVTSPESRISVRNVVVLLLVHLVGLGAVAYMGFVHFSWLTVGLGVLWLGLCGMAITAGYHRLFAHRTYRTGRAMRLFYLLFGAASVQNSAREWASAHRRHHAWTDTGLDPYDASRGFWWSHIGWVFYETPVPPELNRVRDLDEDPLVAWQHRWYVPLAGLMGGVLPALLGFLWGDALGALLCVGFLRLTIQWHMTFSVNSFAHYLGKRPYCRKTSARDSWITALITFGEGYHNFHHRFQADYRTGHRWFHFDITKWFLWSMGRVGLVADLRRTPPTLIARARAALQQVRGEQITPSSGPSAGPPSGPRSDRTPAIAG